MFEPEIETKDYKGKTRRNGERLRLSGLDWFRIGKWGIGAVIIATAAIVTLKVNVIALAKDVEEAKVERKQQAKDVVSMKEDIAVIKNDITKMEIRQEKLEDNDQEQTQLLYEIKGLLSHDTSHLGGSYAGERPIIRRIE